MTLLFAPCFLDEGERLQRNLKWLKYMKDLKGNLKYDHILFVDNASSKSKLDIVKKQFPEVEILENKVHLPRIKSLAYGYWYYAFAEAIKYTKKNGYDKILHIDTDLYILNQKIVDWCNNTNSGWVSQWCGMHNFPETTFQIIGSDQYDKAYSFMSRDFLAFYPFDMAETRIPWTFVEKGFKGDRYGEKNLQQESYMDWYGQCPVPIEMKFKG